MQAAATPTDGATANPRPGPTDRHEPTPDQRRAAEILLGAVNPRGPIAGWLT